jgi:PAS domain S-box-containing protein
MRSGETEGLANHTILVAKDGTQYQIADSGAPILDSEGRIVGVVLVFRDVTREYIIRTQLEQSERIHRQVIDAMRDAVIIADHSGIIRFFNKAACAIYRYTNEEAIGMHATRLITRQSHPVFDTFLSKVKTEGRFIGYTTDVRKDGTTFPAEVHGARISFEGQECVLAVVRDITERKQTLQHIYQLATAVETSPDSVAIIDRQGFFQYANPGTLSLLEYGADVSMQGRSAFDSIVPEQRQKAFDAMQETMTRGMIVNREFTIVTKNNTRKPVEMSVSALYNDNGEVNGFTAVTRDITQRKQALQQRLDMEKELHKAQRLESLGVLAGGIAHDFNNLLAGIYAYIELARMEATGTNVQEHLDKTIATIQRTQDLTRQLLTFAKGGAPVTQVASIQSFVQDEVRFACSGSNISCTFDLPKDLWLGEYDPNQLSQVLNNLVINARHAMPGGGTLSVSARNVTLKKQNHTTLPPGRYVAISIQDTGTGIADDVLPHIFDPFYTTKHEGSGLGLSTSYSIMTAHGGTITVDSVPDKGTTLTLYLPASDRIDAPAPSSEAPAHRGSGTILIMDDEASVRNATAALCQSFGYDTVCVAHGEEALDAFFQRHGTNNGFVACILDMTVPGHMGGKETARKIRDRDTDTVLIVASGYTEDPVIAHPQRFGFTAGLTKPFERDALARVLQQHLPPQDTENV